MPVNRPCWHCGAMLLVQLLQNGTIKVPSSRYWHRNLDGTKHFCERRRTPREKPPA